jgi:hypothetical protein
MHYSLMGKMRLPFIDSDLLYRGYMAGLTEILKLCITFSL